MTEIINLRNLNLEDYEGLRTAMEKAYPNTGHYWGKQQISRLLELFPQGQFVITVNEKVVGCALAIIVKYEKFGDNHTYKEITGNYTFDTHSPKGDTLYGIEVFISPEHRGKRLGQRLYEARKELCEGLNLKAIVFGGRIPNYHIYKDSLSPKEYIQKVRNKEISDPILNFQLSNDFQPKRVLKGYLPYDLESCEDAVLLHWLNIYYQDKPKAFGSEKTTVRLGLVQWQMRLYTGIEDLFQQVEYFVDALAAYKTDFALFPEYFNAPLMAEHNELPESDAIKKLASFSSEMKERFTELAIKYNINIITGSMPEYKDDKLTNVGYLCRRNGTREKYEKIHVTPAEAKYWALKGGDSIKAFDTDCGRIGVLICYDVEFPELSRVLADEGMRILFVPFLADTQTAYSRVRHCAQARAIENECFVAIAGSVGNLPRVKNMDIQYAQSAVLTPCDFAFPNTGLKGETTANNEMILIADVDLNLLDELHNHGSVTNLKDRRHDIYEVIRKNHDNMPDVKVV
ncbi:bifunctional GNAT family N-acetyltransferase/carbon-nitrogen hydrolase family protein [Cytophagaceae bacterium ABcell3]|nr:bifunctional GNAT family N-acetyltransferase/carbon-nitrogen hydrolase family protein [Cytophagaceae bacterium ABcell3]